MLGFLPSIFQKKKMSKENKNVKKKDKFVDDGHTVADMNVEGMKWYIKPSHKHNLDEIRKLNVTKEEKSAIIRAQLKMLLPIIGVITLFFGILYVIMRLFFGGF
ncbi:MAG: hypothetical protein RR086_01550 [Clostridia bacterium]